MSTTRLAIALMTASLVAACTSGPDRYRDYSGPTEGWAPATRTGGSGAAAAHIDTGALIASSNRHQKVGNPYSVGGRTYRPHRNDRYDETGIASWYGPNFHGRPTANGEIFDQHLMTAAHTTLPIPSIAEVTNLENGRSVIVRINDRGPFVDNRIIDLSRAAATELDYIGAGLARVRVRYLGAAHAGGAAPARAWRSHTEPAAAPVQVAQNTAAPAAANDAAHTQPEAGRVPAPGGPLTLQIGAFSDAANAARFADRVAGAGDVWVEPGQSGHGPVFRVYFGRWTDRGSADAARMNLADWGVYDARIVALD
ncbi:septal ring lytic transglycosylase RlpA family protein [Maricaulis sp.]|uniref:septal ring lytic transglycosylase RlpA family protein n=1 Tax=Maricaulis sp. TaxID=1486257 RepID=UPI00261FA0D7|nr:septal ring lytic transglycosylase RlpA family protein [Maricaulis sp.]